MKKDRIKLMCLSGVFAAAVFVLTAYFHIPSHTGYTHIGDGAIYLAACLLPTPYAAAVGAIGALLSDCLTGYAMWAPASVIIKAAAVLFFSCRKEKIICAGNILALLPASGLCIGGYYLYEALITGNFAAPAAGIPGYITQCVLSSIFFILIGISFDKLGIKRSLTNGGNIK